MYTFESRVRYSEVDSNATLTINSLMNYFQDCSTFQTEDTAEGAKIVDLSAQNLAWVVNSWQIVVDRYPKLCEHIRIGTLPYELKGVMGLRNFFMESLDDLDENGKPKRLATANSVWAIVDLAQGVLVRIPEFAINAYELDEKLDMPYAPRRIAIPTGMDAHSQDEILVNSSNIDINNHVNNEQYIMMAMNVLRSYIGSREVIQLRAEYRQQARLGDTITPVVYDQPMTDELQKVDYHSEIIHNKKDIDLHGPLHLYTVCLNDQDQKPYCIVEVMA